jgi:hypothetical protein
MRSEKATPGSGAATRSQVLESITNTSTVSPAPVGVNSILHALKTECPEAIRGTLRMPFSGVVIPILGTIGTTAGKCTIHPAAMALIEKL